MNEKEDEKERAMSIRVPESMHARLRALYVSTGRSMNSMINEAIGDWLQATAPEEGGRRDR
jgi:predicted DNA-binding protein